MKEVQIVKKDSDENLRRQLKAAVELAKSEIADTKRRFNGFILPIEEKWQALEKRINALN